MKILKQFEDKIPTDPVAKLAILRKMCSKQNIVPNSCETCLASFGSEAPGQCSLRRQEPDGIKYCAVPEDWYVPDISTEQSEKTIKFIIAWFRDIMIYHPDRFESLREYVDRWRFYV